MFKQLSNLYDQNLSSYKPFPNIEDRSFWGSLPMEVQTGFHTLAKPYINFTYPQLTATLFMSFRKESNRVNYETAYFKRRNALNALIIAECIEDNGQYMDDIINGIFLICEETAWQLPAHNAYIRDTPSHLLADASRPILDLFACETGALLAVADYILGSKLDAISPVIRKRIQAELDKRIITPYLNEHFWWMGNEDEPMNNWTIWCTQNILLTFFMTHQPSDYRYEAFLKASKSIDYFLKEYDTDGCCDEGALYYRHAGLCLFNIIELLDHITHGFYTHLYKDEKIKNICAYIYNVHVKDQYYINFADCAAVLDRSGVREFLFAQKTNNDAMMDYAAHDYAQSTDPFMSSEINLFYRLQGLQHYNDISTYSPKQQSTPADIFYPSVGLFIVRDSIYTLAVKAGDNDDSHNHNDTGSFTIYKNSKPLFVDIGVETYTAKTFSADRYDIWTMQSDYHNVLTINDQMQLQGSNYKATQVQYSLDKQLPYISLNIATAYSALANVSQLVRRVQLHKESHIQITDTIIDYNTQNRPDIISNLITYEKPRMDNDHLLIGDLAVITFSEQIEKMVIETLPITDPRLQQSWKHDLYRIRIYHSFPVLTMIIQ
ncbi:MAG TPA: heparinase [Epulopiscium sp.]|nr:heparinase [Candidatus Epulonipiscium sp.]